ncbi:MAG TPA: rhomboid family intramembrane serine protease [Phycisphaerales bacterium]|nr:rhomboid family intramembrane serine protease [Phycisphaerales bacterium]
MLIPLSIDRPRRHATIVTPMIIAACCIAFGVQFWLNRDADPRMPPAEAALYVQREGLVWWQLVTYAFLHGGFLHLLGNMLFLWVFGPAIEDRLGHWWFLLFYLAGGAAAGLAHITFERAPALGASGAVAACTGAFLVMFPRTMVRVLIIFIMGGVYNFAAMWVIGGAIMWDIFVNATTHSNVAYMAHLGGYAYGGGIAFALLGLKIIPGEPYDMFSAIKQAKRRADIRGAMEASAKERERNRRPAEVTAREMELRAAVSAALAGRDDKAACDAYRALASEFKGADAVGVLPRDQQYAVACKLYEAGDNATTMGAFASFLKAYPRDREAGQVWLLLGTMQAAAGDVATARASLTKSLDLLQDDAMRELAKAEIAKLPAAVS